MEKLKWSKVLKKKKENERKNGSPQRQNTFLKKRIQYISINPTGITTHLN